jgi:hypothetical protein
MGSEDLVSVEAWRVQVGHSSAGPLRAFELRRDPLRTLGHCSHH